MVLMENLLRERIVFRERRVVAVFVAAAVGTGFRLEGHQRFGHVDIQSQQHIAQHRIGFELEIPVANFDRRMTIAEVIRCPGERERRRCRHQQHRFRRGLYANQSTIVRDQHIATAQHRAARQEHRDFFTGFQRGTQTAFAACIEGQHQRRCTTCERCRDATGFEALLDATQRRRRRR
ncbi:hypothetical protein AT302_09465 [Pandoraea norimbergensis]|uniref:Uncharacterized protein n=1 Tax=Pandoraea norimbergensis TaxID=93219 RepID=A0ABM5WHT0_9BURK|nr:hypothetical protein AT302_09465 [Pandoraea norimbergensis]